jgi:hypothetical protein
MKKLLFLSVLFTGHLFAEPPVRDVDMLVKCEDGKEATRAAQDLNSSIVRGEFYGSINSDSNVLGDMIRVKAPFRVSAPTYVPAGGNEKYPRLCVTVTKK